MSLNDDFAFDVDLGSAEGPAGLSHGELRIFDPTGSTEAVAALRLLGVKSEVTKLGSALMAAANDQLIAGIVVAHDADEELRELFMRAFRARHPLVPVAFFCTTPNDPDLLTRLLQEGATAIIPWPLPSKEEVLPTFQRLFPAVIADNPSEAGFDPPTEAMPVPLPAGALSPIDVPEIDVPEIDAVTSNIPTSGLAEALDAGEHRVPDNEASVLRRKLGDLEDAHQGQTPPVPIAALEKAVKEVAKKSVENTELRGELTLIRGRNNVLEERLNRLRSELEELTRERDNLLHDEPSVPTAAYAELRGGVESYTHAMGSAIEFLEDLQHRVGRRAPSLDAHIRTMKLVKQLLARLAVEARGGEG